jgi:hypothetical protein
LLHKEGGIYPSNMKKNHFIIFSFLFLCLSHENSAQAKTIRIDSLPEVIVKGKRLGYSKLVKECYTNFIRITSHDFSQEFTGFSVLTRNDKSLFELRGRILVNFKDYQNLNYILLAQQNKFLQNKKESKEENLTLYPMGFLNKLELKEVKSIIKSNGYQFKAIKENDEIVELVFYPKDPHFTSQKQITNLKNLEELVSEDAKRFYYFGTLKINKRDLAFESIDIHLVKSKKNTTVSLIKNFKAFDKYQINNEHVQLLFSKNKQFYLLKSIDFRTEWQQIDLGQTKELGKFQSIAHFDNSLHSKTDFDSVKYNLYTISHPSP